jgi:hypothetical protein
LQIYPRVTEPTEIENIPPIPLIKDIDNYLNHIGVKQEYCEEEKIKPKIKKLPLKLKIPQINKLAPCSLTEKCMIKVEYSELNAPKISEGIEEEKISIPMITMEPNLKMEVENESKLDSRILVERIEPNLNTRLDDYYNELKNPMRAFSICSFNYL